MLKRTITIILTSILVLSGAAYCDTTSESVKNKFTLNDLYKIAEGHAESIKIAEKTLYITQKDRSRAFAVLMPRFTAFGEYLHGYSKTDLTSTSHFRSNKVTKSYGIRFDQSFTLNGKELIALKINADQIKRDEFNLEKAKEDYFFQVATAYYNVLQAEKIIKIYEVNVKRLKEHKNRVKTKLKLEQVTKTDLYRAEAEYSGAKTQLVQGINNYKYARAVLLNLVNIPENFILEEPVNAKQFTGTYKSLVDESLKKRADYKAGAQEVKSAERNVSFSRSSYWPTVSFYGTYGKEDADEHNHTPSTSTYDTDTDAASVGIKLAFTIFDGGLRGAEVDQAIAKKKISKLQHQAKKKSIVLEIRKAYLDLQSQISVLKSLKDKLKSSRENYEAVSQHYKYGLKNSIDVMDANSLLIESERNLSNAQFSYRLALINIEYVKGTFLK
ncbi:MAG: TolC family protein [Deltaproteobacteria bacterium]|nr:TolC family protein [Deltaproteobacteria bacterium]